MHRFESSVLPGRLCHFRRMKCIGCEQDAFTRTVGQLGNWECQHYAIKSGQGTRRRLQDVLTLCDWLKVCDPQHQRHGLLRTSHLPPSIHQQLLEHYSLHQRFSYQFLLAQSFIRRPESTKIDVCRGKAHKTPLKPLRQHV